VSYWQRSSASVWVIAIGVGLVVVVAVGAAKVGPGYVENAKRVADRDLTAIWCQNHTGTHPANDGAVAELRRATDGTPDGLLAAVFDEQGGTVGPATTVEGEPAPDLVSRKYAPEPIAETAHRFGHAIVAAQADPSLLGKRAVTDDADEIQRWAKENCTRPQDKGS
jgi:hypothetical protein